MHLCVYKTFPACVSACLVMNDLCCTSCWTIIFLYICGYSNTYTAEVLAASVEIVLDVTPNMPAVKMGKVYASQKCIKTTGWLHVCTVIVADPQLLP